MARGLPGGTACGLTAASCIPHFHADVFWTKASIAPEVLHLWLDTYQTGRDFIQRGIVAVVVT